MDDKEVEEEETEDYVWKKTKGKVERNLLIDLIVCLDWLFGWLVD